jgi:hypothetical protein
MTIMMPAPDQAMLGRRDAIARAPWVGFGSKEDRG